MEAGRALEGDYLETFDGLIFAVKGFLHPPGLLVAFPKYRESRKGERVKAGKSYVRIGSLSEAYSLLERVYPWYLRPDPVFGEAMPEVPQGRVVAYHSPRVFLGGLKVRGRLGCLDRIEGECLEMACLLSEVSGVPLEYFGISGSTMLGLHGPDSDIDLIVYGFREGLKVYDALGRLLKEAEAPIKPYSGNGLRRLWKARLKDTEVSFEAFKRLEAGRRLEGYFKGREYFIRLLNPPAETYGEARFRRVSWVEVEATVDRGSQPSFTPCLYKLRNVRVLKGETPEPPVEAYSLRGRFCEAAWEGERVLVSGKLEEVMNGEGRYFRIVLGGDRNDKIIPAL